MPSAFQPLEPPGEDTVDVPETLACFVEACTWVRHVALAFGRLLVAAGREMGAVTTPSTRAP
jgi:hypothetical protein